MKLIFNKTLYTLKDNIWIVFVLLIFFCLACFNSIYNIGLIEDGVHHFWEAITSNNVFVGHEGYSYFPYNSRYFSSIFSHLGTGIFVLFKIYNIKYLLYIFTFISYFIPVLFLLCIYINIPKNKKNNFEIILSSFILEIIFLNYQIWTENFITGLFLWNIFVIYFYVDFRSLSKFNFISLIIFSLFTISAHPMVVAFLPLLLTYAIIKHYRNRKEIKCINTIFLILSYILLFIALIFNIYFIINPIFPTTNEYLNMAIIKNLNIVIIICSILFIFILSFFNKFNKIRNFIYFIILCVIFNTLFLNVVPSESYINRILGFYIPISFMFILIFIQFINKTYFKIYFRILNIVLIVIFVVNSVFYANLWQKFCYASKQYFYENNTINILYNSSYKIFISQPFIFNIYHVHLYPILFVILQNLDKNKRSNLKINLLVPNESMEYFYKISVFDKSEQLKNFNIDIKDIIDIKVLNEKSS